MVPPQKAKKPSGRLLAIGRSMIRTASCVATSGR
jgi:hypothetical protein